MKYDSIKNAVFVRRPNRFLADVIIDGKPETVHVKNTGRLRELLKEGMNVVLEESGNPKRKTKYSLIAVHKGAELVNIDSQAPNAVAYEALINGKISEIGKPDFVKKEVKYGESRFDLYYEHNGRKGFIEVKGVTLDEDGSAKFPDAPTERGAKHIRELIKARKDGYECAVLFVIQMKGIRFFKPNYDTDPQFSKELCTAEGDGVKILAYDCMVDESSMEIDKKIDVCLK